MRTKTADADLIRTFDREMEGIHLGAKAIGYNATRFLLMLREHGGLETAHRLMQSNQVSEGFTELWMRGRKDLTVEAVILRPQYAGLFSEDERRRAEEKLTS
ncbi:MAG: hypothetical protein H0V73_09145 [Chloroflexi bacterium]|nr:hypothetical protein [Chloroflexota bacterium]